MKTIKFRGQNIKGEWHYGLLSYNKDISSDYEWFISNKAGKPFAFGVIEKSIGQFTGLHDKNGKEIYKGDWCRAEFRTKDGIQVIQGRIIMDEFMWCIDCTGSLGDDIFSINRPHNFEIIGNVFENPELLNEKTT